MTGVYQYFMLSVTMSSWVRLPPTAALPGFGVIIIEKIISQLSIFCTNLLLLCQHFCLLFYSYYAKIYDGKINLSIPKCLPGNFENLHSLRLNVRAFVVFNSPCKHVYISE